MKQKKYSNNFIRWWNILELDIKIKIELGPLLILITFKPRLNK